jgi:hypothetical protein
MGRGRRAAQRLEEINMTHLACEEAAGIGAAPGARVRVQGHGRSEKTNERD